MATASIDIEFARARADLYDLLSRIFDGEVTVLLEAIEMGGFTEFSEILPADVDITRLSRDELDPEALEIGYDNLFEVPGPYYVPPFASGHATDPSESFDSDSQYHVVGTAGELLGDPAESVAELYERTNFTPDRGEGIPDHLAAEFEFMAGLAAQQAQAENDDPERVEELRALQEQLFDHLEWIDAFADAVAEKDSAEGVFAAVCSFASAIVAWDQKQLDASTS
ncbi:TorD/DmsD family molecular chaperone [Halodesulfurarchaeum sp.]|uniref:TorD/DmsD family molecular chaperone n=1 Tax=Halodesulfurarchaeum sp. TaxID=1980530 RepID=UPI002FC3A096